MFVIYSMNDEGLPLAWTWQGQSCRTYHEAEARILRYDGYANGLEEPMRRPILEGLSNHQYSELLGPGLDHTGVHSTSKGKNHTKEIDEYVLTYLNTSSVVSRTLPINATYSTGLSDLEPHISSWTTYPPYVLCGKNVLLRQAP